MFNLGPVFNALNSTFGREVTQTLVKTVVTVFEEDKKKDEELREENRKLFK